MLSYYQQMQGAWVLTVLCLDAVFFYCWVWRHEQKNKNRHLAV